MVQSLPLPLVFALHTSRLLDHCDLLHGGYRFFWVASRRIAKILRTFQVSFQKGLRPNFPEVLAGMVVEESLCGHQSLNGPPFD